MRWSGYVLKLLASCSCSIMNASNNLNTTTAAANRFNLNCKSKKSTNK